jgi:two-component sensor histidine kinase
LVQLSKETYQNRPVYVTNILDVSELVHKEKQLQEMLREKDILIQEINHRVKNNLAIISGLIGLQLMNQNTETALLETQNRIHTIAAVHEQLYNTSSFSKVNVPKYFNALINNSKKLLIADNQAVTINFNSTVDEININDAVPLGLLLNELTTNSIKHAFNGDAGSITIDIKAIGGNKIYFSYMDSGKGFDPKILERSSKEQTSLGMQLIDTLTSQLTDNSTLTVIGKFHLEFEFKPTTRGSHSNL